MSKTNSNSITSILITELNIEKSDFRSEMLNKFSIKDNRIKFYDGTHNPLRYPEMNKKEIDIIARIPGIHKPKLMIEVKASINEDLQNSQAIRGAYQRTSTKQGIPLFYIIPENYKHKNKIPKNATTITWEDIKDVTQKYSNKLNIQINNFVEISNKNNRYDFMSNEEIKKLMTKIEKILIKRNRKNLSRQEDQWGLGFYYNTQNPKNDYFIGFTPTYITNAKLSNLFFSLCIAESEKNINLGDRKNKPLFFDDGWYYFPVFDKVLDSDKKLMDLTILNDIRKEIKKCEVDNIKKIIKDYPKKNN